MTTTSPLLDDPAVVITLFGEGVPEPQDAPAAKPTKAARQRRLRHTADRPTDCARCTPESPSPRYDSCWVCAPQLIALG